MVKAKNPATNTTAHSNRVPIATGQAVKRRLSRTAVITSPATPTATAIPIAVMTERTAPSTLQLSGGQ